MSLRGDVVAILATIAHEAGHLMLRKHLDAAADLSGIRTCLELQRDPSVRSHGEGDATRVAQAFLFPRPATLRALAAHGWDIRGVVAICPTAPVLWAILRLAWVADRGVIVDPPGARIPVVWAPSEIVLPPWDAWAGEVKQRIRDARRPVGVEVYEYADERGETWRVTVLPPTLEASAWKVLAEGIGATRWRSAAEPVNDFLARRLD